MNTRSLLLSSLLLMSTILAACAPAATPAPTVTLAPTDAPATPSPTVVPAATTPPATRPAVVSVDLNQVPDLTNQVETFSVDFLNDRRPLQAFGSLWFLDSMQGKVTRWDPETHEVIATIEVGDPAKTPYGDPTTAVATDDAVWIVSVAAHELVKLDPQTNQIVDRIALPKFKFANGSERAGSPLGLVVLGDTAWVSEYGLRIIQGLDLTTMQVIGTFYKVKGLGTLGSQLLIGDINGRLSIVDPRTGTVVKEFPSGARSPAVSAGGDFWGYDVDGGTISRLDPQTFQPIATIKLGKPVRELKFADGSLWATVSVCSPSGSHEGSYLVKIDPATDSVVGKLAIDGCAFELMVGQDGVWVDGGGAAPTWYLVHVQP